MTQVGIEHHGGEAHGSFVSYIVGFVLATVLTVAAFALIVLHHFSPVLTIGLLTGLAIVQIIVHLYHFLHMNFKSSQAWNNTAFMFAVVCLAIIVGGTLFIMHDVSMNMMSR